MLLTLSCTHFSEGRGRKWGYKSRREKINSKVSNELEWMEEKEEKLYLRTSQRSFSNPLCKD